MHIVKMAMSTDSTVGMERIQDPLPRTSFFMGLISPPGGGKTTFILNMIARPKQFYNQLFEVVHVFSPSLNTVDIPLPEDRLHQTLDMATLENILNSIGSNERCLLIFDDMAPFLTKNSTNMVKICYNRRHFGLGCSLIMCTQKANKIPLELRSAMSCLVLYNTSNKVEQNLMQDKFFLIMNSF